MEELFGELKNDSNFVSKTKQVSQTIAQIEEAIKKSSESTDLSISDKTSIDLFLSYAVSSLFYMYLRIEGENTNSHGIRHELTRIKQVIQRQKEINDKTLRPTIHQDASKRMIRSSLYDFKAKNEVFKNKKFKQNDQNISKKRKFCDD